MVISSLRLWLLAQLARKLRQYDDVTTDKEKVKIAYVEKLVESKKK